MFELANFESGETFYAVENLHLKSRDEAKASLAVRVVTLSLAERSRADIWMFAGVIDPLTDPALPPLLDFVRHVAP